MANVLTFSKEGNYSKMPIVDEYYVELLVGKDMNDPNELAKVYAKVELKLKSIIDGLRASHGKFEDTDFGPNDADPYGAISLYGAISPPDPAGHSKYPAPDTLRWDRPVYEDKNFAVKAKESNEEEEEVEDEFDEFAPAAQEDEAFCTHGKLFIDGSSSGDVVQVRYALLILVHILNQVFEYRVNLEIVGFLALWQYLQQMTIY